MSEQGISPHSNRLFTSIFPRRLLGKYLNCPGFERRSGRLTPWYPCKFSTSVLGRLQCFWRQPVMTDVVTLRTIRPQSLNARSRGLRVMKHGQSSSFLSKMARILRISSTDDARSRSRNFPKRSSWSLIQRDQSWYLTGLLYRCSTPLQAFALCHVAELVLDNVPARNLEMLT